MNESFGHLGHVDLEPFTLFLVALGTAFLIRWIAQSQPTGVAIGRRMRARGGAERASPTVNATEEPASAATPAGCGDVIFTPNSDDVASPLTVEIGQSGARRTQHSPR